MNTQAVKQEFLKAFDTHIDEVFSYFYQKTSNKDMAKYKAENVFVKMWDYIKAGNATHDMGALVEKFKLAA